MNKPERQTRSYLMGLFRERGFHPRTDLGQNFLIDLNIIEFIVEKAELTPNDVVLEVGAGTGGMTTYLAQGAGDVISVEIDPRVYPLAKEATSAYENVTLIHGDALKDKNHFAPEVLEAIHAKLAVHPDRKLKLIANLPYCIGTPVITNLVYSDLPWSQMIITIQRELADRMQAKPSSEDYGALSVWLQSQCNVRIIRKLGPAVFWPRPGVDSAVVRILPDTKRAEQIGDREFFHDFNRRLFTQRRKLARSVLVGMYRKELTKPMMDAILKTLEIPEGVRAEDLDVPTLVRVCNAVQEAVKIPHTT